jgi:hypothetical protein
MISIRKIDAIKLTVIVFLLLLSGCKKGQDEPQKQIFAKIDTTINQTSSPEPQKIYNCEDLLKEIVLSSNLEALKKFKNVSIRTENISDDKITLELYTKNNLSDSPNQKQIVENAVAWLEFIPGNNKLQDITADPESPIGLSFNKTLLSTYKISELCGMKPPQLSQKKADTSCKEIKGDMLSGEECLISSATLVNVYKDIVNKGLVNDSKYLPKELPVKSTSVNIDQNGLMSADFKVQDKKISIEMQYAGGNTEIVLEKVGNNVKRTITYSAD